MVKVYLLALRSRSNHLNRLRAKQNGAGIRLYLRRRMLQAATPMPEQQGHKCLSTSGLYEGSLANHKRTLACNQLNPLAKRPRNIW